MSEAARPLSPHLSIYRPQLTSVLSILHRATGVGLGLGAVPLVWWLGAAAAGPDAFAVAQEWAGSFVGRLLLFGWSWALLFHLCSGIRHLFWDAGYGFELAVVYRSGWAVAVVSAVLTLAAWIWGYAVMGAS